VAHVVLYSGAGCGLCREALGMLRELQPELGFELEVIEVDGDPDLESRYRVELPVVEIDGERAFAYFVDEDALRDRLS
jgi:glutaredoxin